MTDESIREDDSTLTNPSFEDAHDASDAFLKQWQVAEEEQPTNSADEGARDEDLDGTTEATSDDTNEQDEYIEEEAEETEDPQEPTEPTYVDNEDARVKVKVNGEEVEASIKDLKRLYGQEASLTHKSQEVATQRKAVEERAAQYESALETLVKRAQERYAPYAKIDYLVAAKQLDADDLAALRQEATKAYEDVKFLTEELQSYQTTKLESEQSAFVEKARAAIEYLSDPEKGIPGWSEDLYNDIRTHATSNGMPVDEFNKIVDPSMIKIMWKAMRFDKAKKVSTKKVAQAPNRVLKSKAPADRTQGGRETNQRAMSRLKSEGSRDAAMEAFMSRWETSD